MATQPRFPRDQGQQPQLVPRHHRKRRSPFVRYRTAIIAIVTALVCLVLMISLVRRGPARPAPVAAASPLLPQPNNGELKVDSIQIASNSTSQILTLEGRITNTGKRTLNGAQVQLAFRDQKGKVIATLDRPIAGVSGGNCEVTNEFARQPIKANDLRFFCVNVSPVPNDWNHQPPDTTVVTVTSRE